MLKERKIYAVIGAGGSGKRMGKKIPKQFLKIGGTTILETTVGKFSHSDFIDEIVLVCGSDYRELCTELFGDLVSSGRMHIVDGGAERQDSVYEAMKFLKQKNISEDSIVLIHDGVRPYTGKELILNVAETAIEKEAVIPAVIPKDTIRHIGHGILNRSELRAVQTPQGFRFGLIYQAFQQAREDGFYGTDDGSLIQHMGRDVAIVEGEYSNIKITTPEDLQMETRIGTGFDVHKLVEERKLILGGVEIPYEKGLLGHSDADVLTHALMDAMLGAAAMGDIGKLFPDSDDRYKGVSSMKLLEEVRNRIRERGYTLGNADITVICQKPKLSPYIDKMRESVAEVLEVEKDRISIKATTTEKLGFTGRGEGIAAEAVCLLNR